MALRDRILRWADQGFRLAAIAVPAVVALGRVSVAPMWRSDLPVLKGLGLVPVGGPSTLTTIAMQAVSMVPLGPLSFRLAVVSALALAACAWLLQSLARRVLDAHVPGSLLNGPLASIAALTAALGPTMQGEATVGGGATVELFASLVVLHAWYRHDTLRLRRWVGCALLLGLLVSESFVAAGTVVVALAGAALSTRQWPRGREWIAVAAGLSISGALCTLPWALRPIAPHAWLRLGWSLTSDGLAAIDTEAVRTTAIAAWRGEVGTISLGIGALGIVVGLLRKRTRGVMVPMALLIAADLVFPATTGSVLTTDVWVALRMLAIGAVALSVALGVQAAAATLQDMAIPMAKPASALLVMFNLTLVAVTSEAAAFTVDRTEVRGASVWADEGIERLAPNAVVLARSHAVVWRVLAERLLSGSRPDVVLVPFPLVTLGSVAGMVLQAEPKAALLLRDMAIDGAPGEHAVSRMADSRPVYVEFDPRWDARVASHLAPQALWLRLFPQPLGKSDRKLSFGESTTSFERVLAAARATDPPDRATIAVLMATLRGQAVSCGMARDKDAMKMVLDRMDTVDPEDLTGRALKLRLEHASGPAVDVNGLLH